MTKEEARDNIWVQAYSSALNGKKKSYQLRLNDLKTWDKPFCTRENDPSGMWYGYDRKIEALEYLLNH